MPEQFKKPEFEEKKQEQLKWEEGRYLYGEHFMPQLKARDKKTGLELSLTWYDPARIEIGSRMKKETGLLINLSHGGRKIMPVTEYPNMPELQKGRAIESFTLDFDATGALLGGQVYLRARSLEEDGDMRDARWFGHDAPLDRSYSKEYRPEQFENLKREAENIIAELPEIKEALLNLPSDWRERIKEILEKSKESRKEA